MAINRRTFLEMLGALALAPALGCSPLGSPSRYFGIKYVQDNPKHLDALWEGCGLSSPLEMTLEDIERINQTPTQNYRFRPHTLTYYCVKKAQMEGYLPRKGNVIIHIDSHQDFYPPLWEIPQIQKVAALIDNSDNSGDSFLTREEKLEVLKLVSIYPLHIENFMVPLLVDGSVQEIYHLKPPVQGMELPCTPKVWRYSREGQHVTGITLKENDAPVQENELPAKFAEYWIEEPEPTVRELYESVKRKPWQQALLQHDFQGESVILDIDYDYFGCLAEPFVHIHSPEEVRKSVQKVMRGVADLGVKPLIVCQAESPKYTPPELVPVIKQAVQENLKRYGLMPVA